MKIAPDVEKLMWMVAESADAQAVADFESRFPHLRYELSKRIDMVRELKSARRLGTSEVPRPSFSLRGSPPPSQALRFGRLAFACAALGALAYGSFLTTRHFSASAPHAIEPIVRNEPPPQRPNDPLPSPSVRTEPPQIVPDANPAESLEAPWNTPQTVRFSGLPLQSVLEAIAAQSGLRLEVAPGLPNPQIVADYRGMTGLAILADMGPRFGFTAFHQGEGRVIVIPARDAQHDPGETEPTEPTVSPQIGRDRPQPRPGLDEG